MKLWTFQSAELENLLEKQPVFYADWKFTPINWRPAYEWMAVEMERSGIPLHGFSPVWAWHSCGQWNKGPTIGTAMNLLTDYQLLNGVVLIEMNVPDAFCLLSSYAGFNNLLDEVLDHGAILNPGQHHDMFTLPLVLDDFDEIQAAVPCIRMEWIVEIRALDIKPGKSDYDPEQML